MTAQVTNLSLGQTSEQRLCMRFVYTCYTIILENKTPRGLSSTQEMKLPLLPSFKHS